MSGTHGDPPKSGTAQSHADESVLESVKVEGRRLAEEALARTEGIAETRKIQGATYLRDVAAAVRDASQTIRAQGYERTATYTDIAASRLDRIGRDMDTKDLGAIAREMEELARA